MSLYSYNYNLFTKNPSGYYKLNKKEKTFINDLYNKTFYTFDEFKTYLDNKLEKLNINNSKNMDFINKIIGYFICYYTVKIHDIRFVKELLKNDYLKQVLTQSRYNIEHSKPNLIKDIIKMYGYNPYCLYLGIRSFYYLKGYKFSLGWLNNINDLLIGKLENVCTNALYDFIYINKNINEPSRDYIMYKPFNGIIYFERLYISLNLQKTYLNKKNSHSGVSKYHFYGKFKLSTIYMSLYYNLKCLNVKALIQNDKEIQDMYNKEINYIKSDYIICEEFMFPVKSLSLKEFSVLNIIDNFTYIPEYYPRVLLDIDLNKYK